MTSSWVSTRETLSSKVSVYSRNPFIETILNVSSWNRVSTLFLLVKHRKWVSTRETVSSNYFHPARHHRRQPNTCVGVYPAQWCVYVCTCVYANVYMCTCMYVCTCTCVYTYIHMVYVCVYSAQCVVCVCLYLCVCVRVYVYMCVCETVVVGVYSAQCVVCVCL